MSEPLSKNRIHLSRAGLALIACLGVALTAILWVGFRTEMGVRPVVAPQIASLTPPPEAPPGAKTPTTIPATPAPSFDIVRVSPGGDAIVAGRAAAGASVVVLDNGQEIGRATANADGQFVVIPDHPLQAGGRELTLATLAPDGRSSNSAAPVILVVPERTSRTPADIAKTAPPPVALALLIPDAGAPKLLQAPPAPDGSPPTRFGLDVIDYGEHGAIRFAGNAPAGAIIRLYVDNRPVGDAVADANRRWVLSPPADVTPGNHRVRVDLLAAAGRVASRVELPFERAAPGLAEPAGGRVVVQPRGNLWRIARQAYGQGTRYTVIYQANKDQIRNPDLIYPGQVFSVPH